jgi:transcriptional regulator of met regulon
MFQLGVKLEALLFRSKTTDAFKNGKHSNLSKLMCAALLGIQSSQPIELKAKGTF